MVATREKHARPAVGVVGCFSDAVATQAVRGDAADSSHGIEARHTSRQLVVRRDDRVIADSHAQLVLYDPGSAPRRYVLRADIAAEALHQVAGQTFCPYKGLASYRNLSVDEVGGIQLEEHVAAAEA